MRRRLVAPEIWRTCPVNDRYEVSTRGRVRVAKPYRNQTAGQVLGSRYDTRYRYLYIDLWRDGKSRRYYVHKLVLLAFRGPCPPGMESCHKDGNRGNSRLSNLYWGTRKQNIADARRHGTFTQGFKTGYRHSDETKQKIAKAAKLMWSRYRNG